ncbi:MAG: aspartyl/asparaginyl beta-hydroxylase domain-containing protein [Solirubrobacterales bacterium]|nr:aspartyl/asparaginyl beta-hydroxylase domain-containing protein [Solirubrobacterales bacterium]
MQLSDDPRAAALIEFLGAQGAGELGHGIGRSLLGHLVETYQIVRRWGLPAWLQHAALIHSVYGTDAYQRQTVAVSRRAELVRLAGSRAERIAYLFCATPRGPLLAGTYVWMRSLPPRPDVAGCECGSEAPASREELDAVVLLHMANVAEQARDKNGAPATWLVRLRDMAEPLLDADSIALPRFLATLASFTDEHESLARDAYSSGLRVGDPVARASALGMAAAACPVVPEPCLWQAYLAWCRGDIVAARAWARTARERLDQLGTAWDKRLTFDAWLEIAAALEHHGPSEPASPRDPIGDPRRLHELMVARAGSRRPAPARPEPAGIQRFHRYVESLSDGETASPGRLYPKIKSQPWHEPQDFPLAVYLESNFAAIRDEIVALDPAGFHVESERIRRTGDWDVAFFYERGRRRDELCAACPVTAHGIDTYPAMRTISGLIYVSRMGPGTHIAAHRGPTNLRVRCHLGIDVPSGDCAIRVGGETRSWEEGRCLVFDDFFEHEAWNHTDRLRTILIVDLWHPDLSPTEVRLLEGLHSHTYAQARRLGRYWAANAAAMRASATD